MNRFILLMLLLTTTAVVNAQRVDSIYFHLYTDSLKKGTHNYINVDGKMSNGSWLPLTDKEIQFSATSCSFVGNELIVPADFTGEKITVKAILKSKPSVSIERTIWIKKLPDPELPPSNRLSPSKSGRKRN